MMRVGEAARVHTSDQEALPRATSRTSVGWRSSHSSTAPDMWGDTVQKKCGPGAVNLKV